MSLLKSMSNRTKAKGLQKLKYYCQACKKQCRDENGFKCHTLGESHLRQMQLFGENHNYWIDFYSQEFETGFMDIIRRRARSERVAATLVYNEYISDRHHVHMNGTKWTTLSEFVAYLGKTGKCKVEEDRDRGCWFVRCNEGGDLSFVDGRKNKRFKKSSKLAEEEKIERDIVRQIELAAGGSCGGVAKEVIVDDDVTRDVDSSNKIVFALGSSKKVSLSKRNRSVLGELMMREEEEEKETRKRKSHWLCEGIAVKIVANKTKGTVKKVVERFIAEIEVPNKTSVLRVHQDELETVIPHIGGLVRVVNGCYRGFNARLLAIDTQNYSAKVQLEDCVYDGRVLPHVAYEDISKLVC